MHETYRVTRSWEPTTESDNYTHPRCVSAVSSANPSLPTYNWLFPCQINHFWDSHLTHFIALNRRVWVCVCVCMYVCLCMCVYLCMCECVCLCACACACVPAHTYCYVTPNCIWCIYMMYINDVFTWCMFNYFRFTTITCNQSKNAEPALYPVMLMRGWHCTLVRICWYQNKAAVFCFRQSSQLFSHVCYLKCAK